MNEFIEQDCKIEFEGHTFESGGAIVTDDYVIGYMSKDLHYITTWHGDVISSSVHIKSSWKIHSYLSDRMYQVKALINGIWFTGRTLGAGMIVKLKRCKN